MGPETFRQALEGKETLIVDKIECDTLLRSLRDAGVLVDRHVESINSQTTDSKKADKLLNILKHRDDKLLSKFCEILVADGQSHVVDIPYLSSQLNLVME
jgi:Caspase recruitment domain